MSELFFAKPEIPEDIMDKFASLGSDDMLDEIETEEETDHDYEIKVTGNERTFEDGFVRYTKEGKGRYDLIPFDVIHDHMILIDNKSMYYLMAEWYIYMQA